MSLVVSFIFLTLIHSKTIGKHMVGVLIPSTEAGHNSSLSRMFPERILHSALVPLEQMSFLTRLTASSAIPAFMHSQEWYPYTVSLTGN